jgi:hypothetical protein
MRTRKLTDVQRAAALRRLSKYPLGGDNLGWHKHYAQVHNKTQTFDSAHLAMWYLLLHLAFGEEQ